LLLLPVLALTLTACTDAPSGPSDPALAPTAPSFAVISNRWEDVSMSLFNSCGSTPEPVLVSGKVHEVVKQTSDEVEFRTNYELKGVGQTTGNTYVMHIKNVSVVVTLPGPVYVQTAEYRDRMISKGSTDNLFIVIHSTYVNDPSNQPGYFTENTFTSDCKG
jgi:Tfp pilus assembly protein PilX